MCLQIVVGVRGPVCTIRRRGRAATHVAATIAVGGFVAFGGRGYRAAVKKVGGVVLSRRSTLLAGRCSLFGRKAKAQEFSATGAGGFDPCRAPILDALDVNRATVVGVVGTYFAVVYEQSTAVRVVVFWHAATPAKGGERVGEALEPPRLAYMSLGSTRSAVPTSWRDTSRFPALTAS